jgi:hypothetical protein
MVVERPPEGMDLSVASQLALKADLAMLRIIKAIKEKGK